MWNRILSYAIGVLAVALILAQLYQPERTNPPANSAASFKAVAKPSAEVASIIDRSCGDCHSDRTVWPWYSQVAPASWLLVRDVTEGRAKLNFSRWNIYSPEMTHIKMGRICREVRKRDMPPGYYLPMHPNARLSTHDVEVLCSSGL